MAATRSGRSPRDGDDDDDYHPTGHPPRRCPIPSSPPDAPLIPPLEMAGSRRWMKEVRWQEAVRGRPTLESGMVVVIVDGSGRREVQWDPKSPARASREGPARRRGIRRISEEVHRRRRVH
ncbi:uncharacterized protein LOC121055798 [Oryza brachyantha]|uniref:uncharacterized protein LOC121055798 n=1 Tax=Oryza brachyantha TaxID=4533 RepID=UPI001ADA20F4|nr:uncharacterized protein LOC121055798 [Oryza brachyantha]